MLGTVLFLAFWIIVALALFFIAVRGGPRGARQALQTQSRRGRRGASVLFVVLYVALGIAVPVLLLTGNRANANAQVNGIKLTASEKHGRQIFGQICASCHTLHAANADGKVGPNFDVLRPPKVLILDALAHGRQRGNGTMPAGLITKQDQANDVADFVQAVAGK